MDELRDSLKRAHLESERLTSVLHHGATAVEKEGSRIRAEKPTSTKSTNPLESPPLLRRAVRQENTRLVHLLRCGESPRLSLD